MPSGAKKRKPTKKKKTDQSKNRSSVSSTQFQGDYERHKDDQEIDGKEENNEVIQVANKLKIDNESNEKGRKIEHDVSNGIENSPSRAHSASVINSVKASDSSQCTLLEYLYQFAPQGYSLKDIQAAEYVFVFSKKAAANSSSPGENATSYDSVSAEKTENCFKSTVKLPKPVVDLKRKGKRAMIQSHERNTVAVLETKVCLYSECDGRLEQKVCVSSERDDKLGDMQCMSSERGDTLKQKECVSSESGDRLEKKECVLSERDNRLTQKEWVSSESGDALEQKDCVSSESNDKLEEKECISPEIDDRLQQKECVVSSERDDAVEQQVYTYSEIDEALEQKDYTYSKIDEILGAKECVSAESDDRLTLSYYIPFDNGVEHDEDGVNQHVQASPHPVHATSWKICCGLFELFGRSGR